MKKSEYLTPLTPLESIRVESFILEALQKLTTHNRGQPEEIEPEKESGPGIFQIIHDFTTR